MKLQIKEICEAQGIKSAYELAKRTKLNMPTAYRAFANDIKQFTPQTLKALCDALKCSPNDIFGYNEPQTVKPQLPKPDAGKPSKPPQKPKTTASDKRMTTEQVAKRLEPIAGKVLSNRRILDYVKAGKLKSEQSGNRTARFFSEADYLEFEAWYRQSKDKK
jgi:DNA-binding Xre family transcriptional regulator